MNRKAELLTKIANQEIKLGVIGLGYVGLPLSISFAQLGCPLSLPRLAG
jgi:UDP-N-acetyl-D-glucosamine dehydrogenase